MFDFKDINKEYEAYEYKNISGLLKQLEKIASSIGKCAKVAFRINPNVDAGSHDKISTGRQEDKFGIEWPKVSGHLQKFLIAVRN